MPLSRQDLLDYVAQQYEITNGVASHDILMLHCRKLVLQL